MVVTTTTTYHRSSATGAADPRYRRATQLGRCQRIAGVPLSSSSSVYSNGSVGSYTTSPAVSRPTTRHYQSTYTATPTPSSASRASSIDRDLGSDNLWKSEQYFSKVYPSYFSAGDYGSSSVAPRSRAVSVDRDYSAGPLYSTTSPLYGSAINYDMSSGGDNYDDQLYRSALSRLGRSPSVPREFGSSYVSPDVGRVSYDVGRVPRDIGRVPVSSIGTSGLLTTRVTRASSVSRVPYSDDDDDDDEEYYRLRRQRRMRASSLARYRFAICFLNGRHFGRTVDKIFSALGCM